MRRSPAAHLFSAVNDRFLCLAIAGPDPEPPDDVIKLNGNMPVTKLPSVRLFENTRCEFIYIRNSCKTSG